MSKHTEGPWNVECIGNHIEIWKQDGSNHISVAWVHIGDDHTTGELNACLADAHLIAAAPEMYDALKLAERTLSQGPNSDGLDEVRDAIYKAEGKQ